MCIRTIMSMENPDFVVYTGDMVTGHCWDGNPGWVRRQWKDVTRVVTEYNTPYAITMGNHDVEADLTREQIVRLDQENPLSLTQLGPEGPFNSTNISFLNLYFCFLTITMYFLFTVLLILLLWFSICGSLTQVITVARVMQVWDLVVLSLKWWSGISKRVTDWK